MTSSTIGFLFTAFINRVNSVSMFLNFLNSFDSIDLISAEPKKMPSRQTYRLWTSTQLSNVTLICSKFLDHGSMSFSKTLQQGDIFIELMLFMCSSIRVNSSSHPLISLHFFQYQVNSNSWVDHISLIPFMKFSRMASPRACVRISWTILFQPRRSACQRSLRAKSCYFVRMFSFWSNSFQCFCFIASFLKSCKISLTFLQFLIWLL